MTAISQLQSSQVNPSEELHWIHDKRDTLQRVVKITRSLERLLQGLQATLLSGQPASHISKHALRAYEKLSEKTLILPNNQLQQHLRRLDQHVTGILERILEISGMEHHLLEQYLTEPHQQVRTDDVGLENLIEDFKRSAQTAVALRVLLRERGVFSPPLNFTVPEPVIRQYITELERREKQCRQNVEDSIMDILQSTQHIIDNPQTSPAVKAVAQTILTNLQRNLKHIREGKSIENMPLLIEVVELGETTVSTNLSPSNKELQDGQIRGASVSGAIQSKGITGKDTKRGFFSRLKRYITTPINVKWKDIE